MCIIIVSCYVNAYESMRTQWHMCTANEINFQVVLLTLNAVLYSAVWCGVVLLSFVHIIFLLQFNSIQFDSILFYSLLNRQVIILL